jgi:hypothetical protein
VCPGAMIFDKSRLLAPSCWLLAKAKYFTVTARAYDPLPVGIGSGIGWPLGGPSVAQGPPKRDARETQGSIV